MSNKIILTNDYTVRKNTGERPERKANTVAPNAGQTPIRADQSRADAPERKFLTEKAVERIRQKLERAAELAKNARISEAMRKNAAKEAFEEMERNQTSIKFEVYHELDNQLIVKIVKKGTDEVVWQYPPSESLALERLAKYMPGVFLDRLI